MFHGETSLRRVLGVQRSKTAEPPGLLWVEPAREVVNVEQRIAALDGGVGAADAFGFDLVLRLTEARRVHEPEREPADLGLGLDLVAGGAGCRAHDGAVAAGEGVTGRGRPRLRPDTRREPKG